MMSNRFIAILLMFFCVDSFAQQPIKAPPTLPAYRLSKMRVENDAFGRATVVCNYERTKRGEEGAHMVRFVARSESGKLRILGSDHLFEEESGEIGLSRFGFQMFEDRSQINYEIYLITEVSWLGKTYGPFMISNAVRVGNPGKPTKPRPMNDDEKGAYEKIQLDKKPPASDPPDGYELATLSMKLLPGMYVLAGRYGEWEKAEFMGFTSDGQSKLRFMGETKRLIKRQLENWVAVDPKEVERAEKEPASFSPSVATLVDGTLILPRNAVPLDESIQLVPGTPLLREQGFRWDEVIFLKRKGTRLTVRSGFSSMSRTLDPTKFAIKTSVVGQLKEPDIASQFAQNLKSDASGDAGGFDGFPGDIADNVADQFGDDVADEMRKAFGEVQKQIRNSRIGDYEIESPVPANCLIVPEDIEIPYGTKVAACFHFDWSAATVIANNDDGTLEIDWDEHAAAWNGPVRRNQLIIQKKDLKKIQQKATMTPTQLSKVTRVWTDSSGQHTVEANFVRKTAKDVTLRLKDGYEKTLPIDRLCEKDRELLSNLKAEAENPFERNDENPFDRND